MTCHKLAFPTVEAAERTAAVIAAQRNGAGKVPTRIYECPDCGLLHFTSKPARNTRSDSTVATVHAAPAFKPAATNDSPCAKCGEKGALFDLAGQKYHRRCRGEVIKAMAPEDRKAWQREQVWGDYIRQLEARGYTVIPPEAKP